MKNLGTFLNSRAGMMVAGGLVLAVLGYVIVKKLGDAAEGALDAVGDAVNPTRDTNLAYRGVNAVGSALGGDDAFSLGSWVYDLFHAEYDPNADTRSRKLQVREESAQYKGLMH